MQNGKTTEDVKCELHQFERNRYFYGKLMTVRDFETEQRYGQGHRSLHNQSLHGWGVVCGLTVEPKGGQGNEKRIVVHPGVALDCCGHEMVLARDQEVDLSNFQTTIGDVQATGKTVYLCIKYDECTREPVPALANVSTCEEVCDYNRIQERVAFEVLTELPEPEASEVSDACETWMNLTTVRSEIEEGEVVIGGFEHIAPRWVRQGDVFEVRRRITPSASGRTIQLVDTLPTGFSVLDGSLALEVTNTIEGKVAHSTYLVRVDTAVALGAYQITGQVLQSPPTDLPPSDIEVIASTQELAQQIQEELFAQEFAECPRCAEDANSRCVILASIALQQQDATFVVRSIDDVTLDAARGIYRQLVYHTPLIVELLQCLKNDPRLSDARTPLPHAETHQDGGFDEINVTNLSGELADAQRVTVQDEGNPVATRTRLNFTGLGVTASDDPANERVNVRIRGVTVLDDNTVVSEPAHALNFLGGLDAVVGAAEQANISANVGNGLQIAGDQIQPMYGAGAGTVCQGNDPRLSDARTPLPHAATHQDGGSDEINVTNLSGVLADAQRVIVQDEGNPVATRTRLNFIGPGVSVSDDAGNNRIDITVQGGAAARIFTAVVEVRFDGNGGVIPETFQVEELNDGEPFAVILAPQLPRNLDENLRRPSGQEDVEGFQFLYGTTREIERIFTAFVPSNPYNRTFTIQGLARLIEIAQQGTPLPVVCWIIAGAQQVALRRV
jgi:hypothetical protein